MLKPIRLEDSTSYIATEDDAIDWDAMALEHVESSGDAYKGLEPDAKLAAAKKFVASEYASQAMKSPSKAAAMLKFVDGKSPCRLVLGAIPTSELNRIADECINATKTPKLDELKWRAFCASLRGIENWPQPVPKRTVMGIEYVDVDWLSRTFVRGLRGVALEVGMVAWAWNQLTEDEQKN